MFQKTVITEINRNNHNKNKNNNNKDLLIKTITTNNSNINTITSTTTSNTSTINGNNNKNNNSNTNTTTSTINDINSSKKIFKNLINSKKNEKDLLNDLLIPTTTTINNNNNNNLRQNTKNYLFNNNNNNQIENNTTRKYEAINEYGFVETSDRTPRTYDSNSLNSIISPSPTQQLQHLQQQPQSKTITAKSTNSTKRKRVSLFNIFAFKSNSTNNTTNMSSENLTITNDTNLQSSVTNQFVDENTPISSNIKTQLNSDNNSKYLFSSLMSLPPPPEFADDGTLKRKDKSRKSKDNKKSHQRNSAFILTEANHIKVTPTDDVYKSNPYILNFDMINNRNRSQDDQYSTINSNKISQLFNFNDSINTDVSNTSVFYPAEEKSMSKSNSNEVSDADSTISNLFKFDSYLLSPNCIDTIMNNSNISDNYTKSTDLLHFAEINIVEDESHALNRLEADENLINNVTSIQPKNKKKTSDVHVNKKIHSSPTKLVSSLSSNKIDECTNTETMLHDLAKPLHQHQHQHQQQQQHSPSTISIQSNNKSLKPTTTTTTTISPTSSSSSSSQPKLINNNNHNEQSNNNRKPVDSKVAKMKSGTFQSYVNDSDIENCENNNNNNNIDKPVQTKNPKVTKKSLTLEEHDTNSSNKTLVQTSKIHSMTKLPTESANSVSNSTVKDRNSSAFFMIKFENKAILNSNKQYSPEIIPIKKGAKLRELINPVLSVNNFTLENISIYLNNEEIDVNTSCEKFLNAELVLKVKIMQENNSDYSNKSSVSSETTITPTYQEKIPSQNNNNNNNTTHPKLQHQQQQSSPPSTPSTPSSLSTPTSSTNSSSAKGPVKHQLSLPVMTSPPQPPTSIPKASTSNTIINNLQQQQIPVSLTASTTTLSNKDTKSMISNNSNNKRDSATALLQEEYLQQTFGSARANSLSSFYSYIASPTGSISVPNDKYGKPKRGLSTIFSSNNTYSDRTVDFKKLDDKLNEYVSSLPKPKEIDHKLVYFDSSILDIENDWKNVVHETFIKMNNLSPKQIKQQMVIWELLTTEASHIKLTKVIIDLFYCCLYDLKENEDTSVLFQDIEIEKLFCNIIEILLSNYHFWQNYLYRLISNKPIGEVYIDPLSLRDAFNQFDVIFESYVKFCTEQNSIAEYLKSKANENEYFRKFIKWGENHPLSSRLKLTDLLMKPVQRITKYTLLLEKILEFTEHKEHHEELSKIKLLVKNVVNTIDISVNNVNQINNISESIESYDCVVAPTSEIQKLLESYSRFNLKCPMPDCLPTVFREIILQGPLLLKEPSKSTDVHCFIFTDMFLITKMKKEKKGVKYRIIKPPIPTNRIRIETLREDKAFVIFQMNLYNAPEAVFMFVANQTKKWVDSLNIATTKYREEIEKYHEKLFKRFEKPFVPNESIIEIDSAIEVTNNKLSRGLSEIMDSSNNNVLEQECRSPVNITKDKTEEGIYETIDFGEDIKAPVKIDLNMDSGETEVDETANEFAKPDDPDDDYLTPDSFRKSKTIESSVQINKPQYQQHQVKSLKKSIKTERKGRLTDPLTTGHKVEQRPPLPKRNSLYDKTSNEMTPTSLRHKVNGDSTSTIISTDSGVSCTTYGQSNSAESIIKSEANKLSEKECADLKNFINCMDNESFSNRRGSRTFLLSNNMDNNNENIQNQGNLSSNDDDDDGYSPYQQDEINNNENENYKELTVRDHIVSEQDYEENEIDQILDVDEDDDDEDQVKTYWTEQNEIEFSNNEQYNNNNNNANNNLINKHLQLKQVTNNYGNDLNNNNNIENNHNNNNSPVFFPLPQSKGPEVLNIIQNNNMPKIYTYNSFNLITNITQNTNNTNNNNTAPNTNTTTFERSSLTRKYYSNDDGKPLIVQLENHVNKSKNTTSFISIKNNNNHLNNNNNNTFVNNNSNLNNTPNTPQPVIPFHLCNIMNNNNDNGYNGMDSENEVQQVFKLQQPKVKGEKRCATPIDYVLAAKEMPRTNLFYKDSLCDSTVRSGNQICYRNDQQRLMNLLHTTQDATEV